MYYLNDKYKGGETAFPLADNTTLDLSVSCDALGTSIEILATQRRTRNEKYSFPSNVLRNFGTQLQGLRGIGTSIVQSLFAYVESKSPRRQGYVQLERILPHRQSDREAKKTWNRRDVV